MSTPERDEAIRVIKSCIEDPDYLGVAEMLGDEWEEEGLVPGSAEWTERHKRVHDLATSATVTVSWPEEPAIEEPEPDPSDPRQIAIALIHMNVREGAMRHARIAVADQYDLKEIGRAGYAAKVEEVREHIIRATVTVEIPDEVTP